MANIFPALVLALLFTTIARADDLTQRPDKDGQAIEDCSKQNWPNFSPSCLRTADQAKNIRVVTSGRR
jgi:hypothetical protein